MGRAGENKGEKIGTNVIEQQQKNTGHGRTRLSSSAEEGSEEPKLGQEGSLLHRSSLFTVLFKFLNP